MYVGELNNEELLQLKKALFYGFDEDALDRLTDRQKHFIDHMIDAEEIPNKLVYEVFSGIEFTDEDFWCNS